VTRPDRPQLLLEPIVSLTNGHEVAWKAVGPSLDPSRELLHLACAEAAGLRKPVAIGLEKGQLADEGLPARIAAALDEYELGGDALWLEVGKALPAPHDPQVIEVVERCRQGGVQIVLDAFGGGYSALVHLNAVSPDQLKLDRSIVASLDGAPLSRTIVEAVVELGDSLSIPVGAEGVATREQADELRELGCSFAHGPHFGNPRARRL
jgi:diguanylate cyclase